MTNTNSRKVTPPGLKKWIWSFVVLALFVLTWMFFEFCGDQNYVVKFKLSKVVSTLDPIKAAIASAYQKKNKLPTVTTVVTSANQGKPVTPDWAEMGFTLMPSLPREVNTLRITPNGEIVVTITNIAEGIDDTEIRAKMNNDQNSWTWIYQCTSTNGTLKEFFHC